LLQFVAGALDGPQLQWDNAADGCTYVIHCAAPITEGFTIPKDFVTNAVEGTKKIVQACINKGVKKILVTGISSNTSVGRKDKENFNEEDFADVAAAGEQMSMKYLQEKAAMDLWNE